MKTALDFIKQHVDLENPGTNDMEGACIAYAAQQVVVEHKENARLRSLIEKAYFKDHDPEQDLIRNRVMQKAWEQFKKDNNL